MLVEFPALGKRPWTWRPQCEADQGESGHFAQKCQGTKSVAALYAVGGAGRMLANERCRGLGN
jgi:hypothetical protein